MKTSTVKGQAELMELGDIDCEDAVGRGLGRLMRRGSQELVEEGAFNSIRHGFKEVGTHMVRTSIYTIYFLLCTTFASIDHLLV